jgi:DNA-binding transcriptional MerR regulator
LAELAGVNVQPLRFYERRGLLVAPARRPSGQRRYPEAAVGLLCTIKAAQRPGFTLAQIDSLADCSCGLGRPLPDPDPAVARAAGGEPGQGPG